MKKRKLSYIEAAKLEFEEEPMDDYYNNFFLGIFSRWRVKKILDELGVIKGKKILDVGCEAGYVSIKIAQKGARVYAIDIIPKALEKFKEKLKGNPQLKKKIKIYLADARKLPFKNSFFDNIVATEVIEHMPSLIKFAKEAHRTLKVGGKLILTFPNETFRKRIYPIIKILGINTNIENKVTLFSYNKEQVIIIFKRYFNIIKSYQLPPFFNLTNFLILRNKK